MRTSFDLIDEPWIRVRLASGAETELSLRDTFWRAHEITRLAGELATQDAAVLRLLLAILRRSHPGARNAGDWGELWRAGSLDAERVGAYLERWRDRFDLLHHETPFYQVAALRTARGELKTPRALVADVPPKHQFFTTRAGAQLDSLDLAEAARWVLHCQAYDVSGIKSGALDDPRVKGGKGYPIGTGWCGWLGLVILEGDHLAETLLLNLPLGGKQGERPDSAVWERSPQGPASEARTHPDGPVDLLTWQSRRIRLVHEGERVVGALVTNGDPLHPRNQFQEYMTSWRRSEAQMKALGTKDDVWMPRGHAADRAVWRGLEGMLAESEVQAGPTRAGTWLEWLERLRRREELPESVLVRVRAVGIEYGSNSSVYANVVDDGVTMAAGVLADTDLRKVAVRAVRIADDAVRAVATLAGELSEAAGLSGKDEVRAAQSRGRELAYAALDSPYRDWLRTLTATAEPGEDGHDTVRWQVVAGRILVRVGRDLIRQAGDAAWIGREMSRGTDRVVYLDAALAELGFQRRLRGALPNLPSARTDKEPTR